MTVEAVLVRTQVLSTCVRGWLLIGDTRFATLEPAWRNNARNVSCILPGSYEAKFMPRSSSGKYKKVYWLQNTPGRYGVLIHNGNLPAHTRGCILLGTKWGYLAKQPAVLASRTAMHEFVELTDCDDLKITIYGTQTCSIPSSD